MGTGTPLIVARRKSRHVSRYPSLETNAKSATSPSSAIQAAQFRVPYNVTMKGPENDNSLICVGGVWVHQGRLEPGADCENIIDVVREERIRDILKSYTSSPRKKARSQEPKS